MGEKELRQEISDMYFPNSGQEEETTDGQGQEQASGDGEGQEQAQGEQEETQEVVQPAADAGGEAEETVEERYARLMQDYNLQSQRLLELESRTGMPQQPAPPLAAPVVTPAPSAQPRPEFVFDEATLERALIEDDPKAMKQVLTGLVDFIGKMQTSQEEVIRERVLRDVPALANQIATEQVRLQLAITEFYSQNSDLVQYRGVVGAVMNEVVAKEPQLTLAEAFDKTEVETRRRLGIKKQLTEADGGQRRPAFAKPSGSRKPGAPQLTGLKDEIAQMIRAR